MDLFLTYNERVFRGVAAWLAAPFLLLAALALVIEYCIAAPRQAAPAGTLPGAEWRAISDRGRSWWWVLADVVAGALGVGALDLLVEAF